LISWQEPDLSVAMAFVAKLALQFVGAGKEEVELLFAAKAFAAKRRRSHAISSG
jgi:hypothetical protein